MRTMMLGMSIVSDLIKAIKPIFVLFLVSVINGIAYSAGAQVEDLAFFRADEECDLYSNIETKENIDSVRTILGKEYRINLDGDSNKEYLNIIVDGAYPDNRWVKKYCGKIRTTHDFDPFFVAMNPKDGQVLFPTITEFDQMSLDKCGALGGSRLYMRI